MRNDNKLTEDLRTCVSPDGHFVYSIHMPDFHVENFRENDNIRFLGTFPDGSIHTNHANFPPDAIDEHKADTIFEIPNPFGFRGTTYITKRWADENASHPEKILLSKLSDVSFSRAVNQWSAENISEKSLADFFKVLPESVLLCLAVTSTDPDELVRLAHLCCEFIYTKQGNQPCGLLFKKDKNGRAVPVIHKKALFETLVNNDYLPEIYKQIMVLRPGVQGDSEIVGEWQSGESHVFEYLRRNSYIPWGHYAANMADDQPRYRLADLKMADIFGMRHLYYQRTFSRLAEMLTIKPPFSKKQMSPDQLEMLRKKIVQNLSQYNGKTELKFNCTLWGWNYGFDFSPTKYRLHASHQQVHQQYALIPAKVRTAGASEDTFQSFACGDLIAEFTSEFREKTGKDFFECYLHAIRKNRRMDQKNLENSLIIYEDAYVMIFVPKAQTSQWEIQLMVLPPVGNVVEAHTDIRQSLDKGMYLTMKILGAMGARMISVIEYAKRLDSSDKHQRLLYAFLPKIPYSPGAFSEAQLRWINGHYPEDFAACCRMYLEKTLKT